jgi:hypothetical protein
MVWLLSAITILASLAWANGQRETILETLPDMFAAADVVAFVRCDAAELQDVLLPVVDTHGSDVLGPDGRLMEPDANGYLQLGEMTFRFTPCTVVASLKGDPPESITVVTHPPGGSARVPTLPTHLPQGKVALVFLQRTDERRFLEADRMRAGACYTEVQVPPGTYGLLDLSVPRTVTIMSAPTTIPDASHPVRRLLLILADQLAKETAEDRLAALRWLETVDPSRCLVGGGKSVEAELLGEGYDALFTSQIEPVLREVVAARPVEERLRAYVVLLAHGRYDVAEDYIDRLIEYHEHGPHVPGFLPGVVSMGQGPDSERLYIRLLGSSSRHLVEDGLLHLREVGTATCRPHVRALLDADDLNIVAQAMATLAFVDKDMDHLPEFPAGGQDFSDGSRNAELLQYWRDKQ